MATTSIYLNFATQTEEAFNFYKSIFGGEFVGDIARMGDMPMPEGALELSDADKKLIMHIDLPILGGFHLMGTDAPPSMGFNVVQGNNTHINLEPDTQEEAQRLFGALSEGGIVTMPYQKMPWGAFFGSFSDKFGMNWMVNCTQGV